MGRMPKTGILLRKFESDSSRVVSESIDYLSKIA